VCICKAKRNDNDEEFPPDAGVVLTREDWIEKMKGRGPGELFADSRKCGLYVRINPMPKRCRGLDSEVMNFRHVLVEFDSIPLKEQWELLKQSGLPISAVVHSGGKSVHGWVRVDAADRQEYDERRRIIYEHFERYKIDPKNGNPSRFSRFPGVPRGKGLQLLLAVNIGAPSFTEWFDGLQVPAVMSPGELLDYNTEHDENNVLGNRWLCRGGSCLWIAQTGVGKSAMQMQAAVTWALGGSFFGVKPERPLKSLIVQAENDKGDLAEEVKGVVNAMDLSNRRLDLDAMVKICSDSEHYGEEFVEIVGSLVRIHKPDLVWFDPLLAYLGGDISSQETTSHFLRNLLNPLSHAHGFIWMIMHHTNKPAKDPNQRNSYVGGDFAYLGQGAAEIANWARAVVTLREVKDSSYELRFSKRGMRAGLLDNNGQRAIPPIIHVKHSKIGICWLRDTDPEIERVHKVLSQINSPMKSGDIMQLCRAVWGYGPRSESKAWDKFTRFVKPHLLGNGDVWTPRLPSVSPAVRE